MMNYMGTRTKSPAPVRRRNSVLLLYDRPLRRDWAFWTTIGFAGLAAVSIGTSSSPSSVPRWLNTLLAVIFFAFLFGIVPALVRLLVRRRRLHDRHPAQPGLVPWGSNSDRPPAKNAYTGTTAHPQPVPQPPEPRAPAPARYPKHPASSERISLKDPVRSSPILMDASRELPYPIAHALHETQRLRTRKNQYEALLASAEIIAITVSVTTAALIQGQRRTHDEDGLLSKLSKGVYRGFGASFGSWTNWLDLLGRMPEARLEMIAPGLADALKDDSRPSLVRSLHILRDERNRPAHGDRTQSEGEAALRVEQYEPILEDAVSKMGFLQHTPWVYTTSVDYHERPSVFEVDVETAMGNNRQFDVNSFTWDAPIANNTLYVLRGSRPVSLSPFCAVAFCRRCLSEEVCYTSRFDWKSGAVTLKSFDRGHEIDAPPDWGEQLRSLAASV